MPKYFKPEVPADNRNYQVTRIMRNGLYTRDQLPFEGIYTAYEMSRIVENIPGEWLNLKSQNVGYVFGLRQILTRD